MNSLSAVVEKLIFILVTSSSLAFGQEAQPSYSSARLEQLPLGYKKTIDNFNEGTAPKMIGGATAKKFAYPWQASLQVAWIRDQQAAHFCGGTVISERWILTAAHCVKGLLKEDFFVVLGAIDLSQNNRRYRGVAVLHPKYMAPHDNDIALVRLDDPVAFTKSIKKIPLVSSISEETSLVQGENLTASGWGADREGGKNVRYLQFIEVPYVSREKCNLFQSYDGAVSENMICAGSDPKIVSGKEVKDACQGDSGGPLVAKSGINEPVLVGVTSWGEGCARDYKFGVYTRVLNYRDWISECTRGGGKC